MHSTEPFTVDFYSVATRKSVSPLVALLYEDNPAHTSEEFGLNCWIWRGTWHLKHKVHTKWWPTSHLKGEQNVRQLCSVMRIATIKNAEGVDRYSDGGSGGSTDAGNYQLSAALTAHVRRQYSRWQHERWRRPPTARPSFFTTPQPQSSVHLYSTTIVLPVRHPTVHPNYNDRTLSFKALRNFRVLNDENIPAVLQ